MQSIRFNLWFLFFLITGVCFLDAYLKYDLFTYWGLQSAFIEYSGVAAFATMSLCMYSAARPKWLEKHLNGLDRSYRFHKWLGIFALLGALTHWFFSELNIWLIKLGWFIPSENYNPSRVMTPSVINPVIFAHQYHLAELFGALGLYLAVILIVVALVKHIPYHIFARYHKLLALCYLLIIFHVAILCTISEWGVLLDCLLVVFFIFGVWGSFIVLTQRIGNHRKYRAEVIDSEFIEKSGLYSLSVKMLDKWPGHKPGQFVFLNFDNDNESPHPYTIASVWDSSQVEFSFIIKDEGDYTARMHKVIKLDDKLTIEGPYGGFTFEDNYSHQIWIAGGIGVAPFIARLQYLGADENSQLRKQNIVLYYCCVTGDPFLADHLKDLAKAANVKLYIISEIEEGRLEGQQLRQRIANMEHCSIWFCGPDEFADELYNDLKEHGLKNKQFHRELFEIR